MFWAVSSRLLDDNKDLDKGAVPRVGAVPDRLVDWIAVALDPDMTVPII